MSEKAKRLRVLAGPNGSGKSTVIDYIQAQYHTGKFINSDLLQRQLTEIKEISLSNFDLDVTEERFQDYLHSHGQSWLAKAKEKGKEVHLSFFENKLIVPNTPGDYDAAMAADFIRYQLLEGNNTFTFETVLSDGRKFEFLREAVAKNFKVYLYFVCTGDPAINIARIANRVQRGGHDVPRATVIDRYSKSLSVLPRVIPITYRCFLFDNSTDAEEGTMNLFAEVERGKKLRILSENVPHWADALFDQLISL